MFEAERVAAAAWTVGGAEAEKEARTKQVETFDIDRHNLFNLDVLWSCHRAPTCNKAFFFSSLILLDFFLPPTFIKTFLLYCCKEYACKCIARGECKRETVVFAPKKQEKKHDVF